MNIRIYSGRESEVAEEMLLCEMVAAGKLPKRVGGVTGQPVALGGVTVPETNCQTHLICNVHNIQQTVQRWGPFASITVVHTPLSLDLQPSSNLSPIAMYTAACRPG